MAYMEDQKSKLDFVSDPKKNIIYLFIKHEQSDSFQPEKSKHVDYYNSNLKKITYLIQEIIFGYPFETINLLSEILFIRY